jgi:hypothetical protein
MRAAGELDRGGFGRSHRVGGDGEWLYVFKPELAGTVLYVKLIVRLDCIVVSFHEDAGGHEEDA